MKAFVFGALLILAALLVPVLGTELVLRVFVPVDAASEYREILGPDTVQAGKPFVARKFQPKRPHPYIGYVYNDLLVDGVNKDGFRDLHQFPYSHDKDEFVIGVFGGSFASDFAETQEFKLREGGTTFADRLRARAPEFFKDKKITVLNFGLAAGRQPQQYIAISLYLESLDMVLVIDGFNEAFRNRELEFPTYFPFYSQFFYSKEGKHQQYWDKFFGLRKTQRALTEFIMGNPVLKSSQLVYRGWRSYANYVDQQLKVMADSELPTVEFPEGVSFDEYNREKANIWSKYAKLQAHILKGERIPYLHVLQPNQYLPDTKVLSEEEKEKFLWRDNPNIPSTLKTYELIFEDVKRLNESGIEIVDLTKIYKDHPETVYRDRCCHVNRVGHDIFEEAVAIETARILNK